MDEAYRPFVLLGMVFLALGFALVALPLLARVISTDLKIPKSIVYVYNRDNFYFATSPLLIVVSLAYILYFLWSGTRM